MIEAVGVEQQIETMCINVKSAADVLAMLSTDVKNYALVAMAEYVQKRADDIIKINQEDVVIAGKKGLSAALLDRLRLTPSRIQSMVEGIKAIASLPDPVGRELATWAVPSGLHITRKATPLGVIGVIYEARPNVTADAAALCFKSGNAVILRGGSECAATNKVIVECLQEGLQKANVIPSVIQYVPTQERSAVDVLLKQDQCIDVIVPRGGKALIQHIREHSTIPVFSHLDGICHTYIHEQADPTMAVRVIENAKMRRTGICGATETVLIDAAIAESLLPEIIKSLNNKGCEIRGDVRVQKIDTAVNVATDADWATEYLDAIISIKVVDDIYQAIEHIKQYGSNHTDAIITDDKKAAALFLQLVNSANVMHNCSTQFADGGEFGMGAEIGIATGKMHARGPVGLEQLTTFKYVVKGDGQVRA